MAPHKKTSYSENEIIDLIVNKLTGKDQETKQSWEKYNFFRGNVRCDYDRSGCDGRCDDYCCRCSKIINATVVSVDVDEMVKNLTNKSLFPILNYCVDRILRNHEIYDTNNFEVNVVSGYYGEETDGCSFDPSLLEKMVKDISDLKDLSSIDKIKHVLKGEYGYLIPKVENCSAAQVIDIEPSKVIFPQGFYQNKIKSKDTDYYQNYDLPRCVMDQHNQIIDGYHRTTSAIQNNLKKIQTIVIN